MLEAGEMKAFVILACLLLSLFPPDSVFSQPVTLVTLGDSLTAGDNDDGSGGGYPARLIAMLESQYTESTLHNLSISGDTSTDLINKQLDSAVSVLNGAPASDWKVALVWIGSNDLFGLYNSTVCADYYPSIETCEVAERGLYSDNVNQTLSALSATGASVYVALLDDQSRRPVMSDPVLRMSQFDAITDDDVSRMRIQIPLYNAEVQHRADALGVTTVDFFHTTIFEDPQTLSDDGNHPKGAGYDLIAGIWHRAVTGARPRILANGTAGILPVTAGTAVQITVSLDPRGHAGEVADWWAGYRVNDSWSAYVHPTGWSPGIASAHQGGLVALSDFTAPDLTPAPGAYTFYFGVDTTADAALSVGTLLYDYVRVVVE